MDSPSPSSGSSDFQQELLAIRQDPQVRRLALQWARDPDLAEDDLQTAYCKIAAIRKPERIVNRRAYFLRVLKNEAIKRYAPRHDVPLEDPAVALTPAWLVDEQICNSLRDQTWLDRLVRQRDRLLAVIPGRSADSARYRALIYNAALHVLCDAINAEPSDTDSNRAFRAAYPEYFNQPGAAVNTCHQRFRRAREDVKTLLQAVVNRDELT